MTKTPTKDHEVFYQAPGESGWHLANENQVVPEVLDLRRRARALLREGDVVATEAVRARRSNLRNQDSSETDFERDMAKALHAWGRYVKVESRRLYENAESLLEVLVRGPRQK